MKTIQLTVSLDDIQLATGIQFKTEIKVPPFVTGKGSGSNDLYRVIFSNLTLWLSGSNQSWMAIDMLENGTCWSFTSASASGEMLSRFITSMSDASIATRAYSRGGTFSCELFSPVLSLKNVTTTTYSSVNVEFSPDVDSPVPTSALVDQSARATISVAVYGRIGNINYKLKDLDPINIFISALDDGTQINGASLDISDLVGIPWDGTKIDEIQFIIKINIDVSNTTTPNVKWGVNVIESTFTVADMPPQPRIKNIFPGQTLHGITSIIVEGAGDEESMLVEYWNGSMYKAIGTTTTHYSSNYWHLTFDTRNEPDIKSTTLRVRMLDRFGQEGQITVSRIEIDNTPSMISAFSVKNGSIIAKDCQITATADDDTRKVIFQAIPFGCAPVTLFTDSDASDGWGFFFTIRSLPEGQNYTFRAIALDETGDMAAGGRSEASNVSIIYMEASIIHPDPNTISNGDLSIYVATNSSMIDLVVLCYGITLDGSPENVSSWIYLGNRTTAIVNNTFVFDTMPATFGCMDADIYLNACLYIDGLANDTAVLPLHVDTIYPEAALKIAGGAQPCADGYW
nr:hypothetical protein [Candidatus Sigynarchaeota archaeon]